MQLGDLQALELLHRTIVKTVREDSPDLSARQMALLLTVYLTEPPHTVRGMAETLNVSKPAITRALDRLTTLKFIRRKKDDADRRNVLIQRTVRGSVFLREYGEVVVASAQDLNIGYEDRLKNRPGRTAINEPQKPAPVSRKPTTKETAKDTAENETWFTDKLKDDEV
jgi:DNA-binding MarR family transcriptional regulator